MAALTISDVESRATESKGGKWGTREVPYLKANLKDLSVAAMAWVDDDNTRTARRTVSGHRQNKSEGRGEIGACPELRASGQSSPWQRAQRGPNVDGGTSSRWW